MVQEVKPEPGGEESPAAGHRVLIVDDEDGVRAMLVELLGGEGFECLQAPDAEKALEIIEKTTPSLGILDLALPGMNGAELAWRIRERMPKLPLIALSGQLKLWEPDDLKDLGFARVFAKPMDCAEFIRVCREACEGNPAPAAG